MDEFICKYCGKICKNKNSLIQHEIRCKENPNKINVVSNFINYNNDVKNGLRKGSNKFIKYSKLGIKLHLSQETKDKISKKQTGKKHSQKTKDKISKSIRKAVINHPDSYSSSNVNGRVKKVEYNNQIYDSSWEVIFVKYLEGTNYTWCKNKQGFEYIWNDKTHIYYPDFYINDLNIYVEVKGYKRDRDIYKWKSVDNLIIISKNEINDIENSKFDILSLL